MAELKNNGLETGSDFLTHALRGKPVYNSTWMTPPFTTPVHNASNRNPTHYILGSMMKSHFPPGLARKQPPRLEFQTLEHAMKDPTFPTEGKKRFQS